MLETLSAVHSATESKKMGRMVTMMTEWALLAQSYIIQLISCLVYPFRIDMKIPPVSFFRAAGLHRITLIVSRARGKDNAAGRQKRGRIAKFR